MKETSYDSFCTSYLCKGCRLCVKGEKLVLFLGGSCSRDCTYCSLGEERKSCQTSYANERPIVSPTDLITEAKESHSKGAGVTGGDPLIYLNKTIGYTRLLKEEFGEDFHIHIYLPMGLVDEETIKKLSETVDEVRFHPSFLINNEESLRKEEIEKIKMASEIFTLRNTGIELPCIPDKKEEIISFIKEVHPLIGFLNLNEFEISQTNFEHVTRKYSLEEDGYRIHGSLEAGKEIIKEIEDLIPRLPVHLCSARTKDSHQFKNRLKRHNILPFGKRTKDKTVVYFAHYSEDLDKREKLIKKITKKYFIDKNKGRIIINMSDVEKVSKKTGIKIARVEEYPTFDSDYLEFGYIDE